MNRSLKRKWNSGWWKQTALFAFWGRRRSRNRIAMWNLLNWDRNLLKKGCNYGFDGDKLKIYVEDVKNPFFKEKGKLLLHHMLMIISLRKIGHSKKWLLRRTWHWLINLGRSSFDVGNKLFYVHFLRKSLIGTDRDLFLDVL